MIERFFHRWEQRLADVSRSHRVVRTFDWGLDWIPANGFPRDAVPLNIVRAWVDSIMQDTDAFFTPAPTSDYVFDAASGWLKFPSALATPHPENNVVHARLFPAGDKKRAIVVMPQWNSDERGHMRLSQLLARLGISALRLSKPYHDVRMPPELTRAARCGGCAIRGTNASDCLARASARACRC